ncbi:MAG: hypothetical protein L0216_08310 [Planctomycetales bacterium]|nr:hypothetical protein [Planctomycetales bacterium]
MTREGGAAENGDGRQRLARRALLRAGAYVVPALLGSFAVTRSAEAHTTGDPTGIHCIPCTPHGGPGCTPPCPP